MVAPTLRARNLRADQSATGSSRRRNTPIGDHERANGYGEERLRSSQARAFAGSGALELSAKSNRFAAQQSG